MPIVQCEFDKWPSGDDQSIAVLQMEPSDLEERLGLRFAEGTDDLDYFRDAAVSLPSGRRLLLVRYLRNESPGTEVRADANDDAAKARSELAEALGGDSIFTWVSE